MNHMLNGVISLELSHTENELYLLLLVPVGVDFVEKIKI